MTQGNEAMGKEATDSQRQPHCTYQFVDDDMRFQKSRRGGCFHSLKIMGTIGSACNRFLRYFQQVAPYKKVRKVEFIKAIPKSSDRKIPRKELIARHQQ